MFQALNFSVIYQHQVRKEGCRGHVGQRLSTPGRQCSFLRRVWGVCYKPHLIAQVKPMIS